MPPENVKGSLVHQWVILYSLLCYFNLYHARLCHSIMKRRILLCGENTASELSIYYDNAHFQYLLLSGRGGLFMGSTGIDGGSLVDSLGSAGVLLVGTTGSDDGIFSASTGSTEGLLVGSTGSTGGLFVGSTGSTGGLFVGSTGSTGGLFVGSTGPCSFSNCLKSAEYIIWSLFKVRKMLFCHIITHP